jgi:hypothetical protein
MFVFPLNAGARFTLAASEHLPDKRVYDLAIEVAVVGEEEIATGAGTFRAVKIDRRINWKRRDKPSDAGVNTWTYWYSGAAKRWVVATQSNVSSAGKQLQNERWELESYRVK